MRYQQGKEEDGTIEVSYQDWHAAVERDRQQQPHTGVEKDGKEREDHSVAVDGADAPVAQDVDVVLKSDVLRTPQDVVIHEADANGFDEGVENEEDEADKSGQDEEIARQRFTPFGREVGRRSALMQVPVFA